jgi:hypothetical protein
VSLCKRGTRVQGDGHRVCRADKGAGPKSTSGCGGIGAKIVVSRAAACVNRCRPVLVFGFSRSDVVQSDCEPWGPS